jgi:hypothetical protein
MTSIVSYEAVAKAIDELERENVKPTVANVRNKVGGGSNNKILSVMNDYFKNTRPELPPVTSEWAAKIMKFMDEFSADRSTRAALVFKKELDLALINQGQIMESERQWEESYRLLQEEVEVLKSTNVELTTKISVLSENLRDAKVEIEKANNKAQAARDELLALQIKKEDLEVTKAELKKSQDEALQAMKQAAHLTGVLEGRGDNMTDVPDIGEAKIQPDSKNTRIPSKKNK